MTNTNGIKQVRSRILLLSLSTIMPVVLLIFYINTTQLKQAKDVEIYKLKSIVNIISSENNQIIEGVRQILITLSVTPEVSSNPTACNKYLNNILNRYKRYSNFGVADNSGTVVCSAIDPKQPIDLSDRYFFKQTQLNNGFTIGEYVISRVTNTSSLNFGYPTQKNNGVIYATLNLEWLNKLVSELNIPESLEVAILDRNGTVLTASQMGNQTVGFPFSNKVIVDLISKQDEGAVELKTKSDRHIYLYKKMGLSKDAPFVIVSQKFNSLYAVPNTNFNTTIIISFIVMVISIAVGTTIGNNIINRSLTNLKEIDSLKDDFISLVSHQIRTPITAIKWFTEILLSKTPGKLNKKQENILKDTHLSTKRMIELVGMLLDITKLESKKISINRTNFSIEKMVTEILKLINLEFKNKKIRHKIKVDKNFPKEISADPKLIRQALLNLIHNAFKYSKPKGAVLITLTKRANIMYVLVSDKGIGVPTKDKGMLFQKFTRASNAKIQDTEGAGLGLYLTKLIAEAHGGKVFLKPRSNQGTSIYFTIPLI